MEQIIKIPAPMSETQADKIEQTVKKERTRLFNFIRQRVADVEEAEDILQDTFYQFVDAYHTIQEIEKTTAWLFRVARNKITDWYRKKKTQSLDRMMHTNIDEDTYSLAEILPDLSNQPESILFQELIWTAINEVLAELPPKQREVFVLHEFEGKSFKEIAEITGETVNTLLSRKRYAILELRKRLQNLYEEL